MVAKNIFAIVPAAGVGSRMGQPYPKQYLKIQGKTILEHTLTALLTYPLIQQVIVALAKEDTYYSDIACLYHTKVRLVEGGATRAESVYAALKNIEDDTAWVMVHDAARPCIQHSDLDKLVSIENPQGAILATPVTDTIKRSNVQQCVVQTEDRAHLWHALTPQFFPIKTLKQAYAYALAHDIEPTDDASAVEMMGITPQLIAGRSDNLKITRPEDLALATFYLSMLESKK